MVQPISASLTHKTFRATYANVLIVPRRSLFVSSKPLSSNLIVLSQFSPLPLYLTRKTLGATRAYFLADEVDRVELKSSQSATQGWSKLI